MAFLISSTSRSVVKQVSEVSFFQLVPLKYSYLFLIASMCDVLHLCPAFRQNCKFWFNSNCLKLQITNSNCDLKIFLLTVFNMFLTLVDYKFVALQANATFEFYTCFCFVFLMLQNMFCIFPKRYVKIQT